jgi:hypothetical protein
MADLWNQLVKKYPRYTIAILLVYALLVSAYTIYSSVRSYYIELKKPYLEDLAEACGNISECGAHFPLGILPHGQGRRLLVVLLGAARALRGHQSREQDDRLQNVLETINPSNYSERKLQLEQPAYAISGACRDLIKKSWELSIAPWSDLQSQRSR